MKPSILLMTLIGVMFFSCKKSASDAVSTSLEGTWKMILVKDNTTNASITKPSSIKGDVIITFVPKSSTTGTFTGITPSNRFGPNDYSIGPNQVISLHGLSMTEVNETSWGAQFADNIGAVQQYSFETGGISNIRTTNKTLAFKKQ